MRSQERAMTHYLISLRADRNAEPVIRDRARASLAALSQVSDTTEGEFLECWSAFKGEEMIAIFRSAGTGEEQTISRVLEHASSGFSIRVTELTSLREMFARDEDDPFDAVDLASDLSFPASDVPAWPQRDT
jgi:hypothetical protein